MNMIITAAALLLVLVKDSASSGLPVITTELVNVTTEVGAQAKFFCEATGQPTPGIVILKKVRNVEFTLQFPEPSESEDNESHEVSATKVLNNVIKTDEAWYVCVASNKHGRARSLAYLDISDRQLCKEVKCPARKYCHADYVAMTTECRCAPCTNEKYEPVCGADCNTYLNVCHLKRHSCENNLGLSISHRGECNVEPAVINVPGPKVQVAPGDPLTLTCEVSGTPVANSVRWGKVMRNGKLKLLGAGPVYTVDSASEARTSGRYRCLAQQCRKRIKSQDVEVEVVSNAVEDPAEKTRTCRVFGDPHIQTFDGTNFDFMGRCNYILAVDCFASKWMVLGQFMPCGDGVTCLEQLTVYYGAMRPLIIARGWIVGQDGEKFRLKRRQSTKIDEVYVTYMGLSLEVDFPDGVQLIWDGFWGVQIRVSAEQVTCGLCGNNNGDSGDDVELGRYGLTGGDVVNFGQSWAMWNNQWCGLEVPSENKTCPDLEAVERRCDEILNSQIFGECVVTMGVQFFKDSCVIDGCRAKVERFEGDPLCAFINSFSQMCQVSGYDIPSDFLQILECGSNRKFQEDVYNAGCPLAGDPPFLEI